MERLDAIREIDLLAYADKLLEADPQRKRAVERHLSVNPQAAAFVAEIEQQNLEIRECFGRLDDEQIPDRLASLFHGRPRRGRQMIQAAAVAGMLFSASLIGWLIGQNDGDDDWALEGFVERAVAGHSNAPTYDLGTSAVAGDATMQPLGWLKQRVTLELAAPDLVSYGFELRAKQQIGSDDDPMVRLVYQRADGVAVNLFLRPRWNESGNRLGEMSAGGVHVHYWLEGPLAFAMTTNAATVDSGQLADAVRRAIGPARLNGTPSAMALSHDGPGVSPAANDESLGRLQQLPPGLSPPDGDLPSVQVN